MSRIFTVLLYLSHALPKLEVYHILDVFTDYSKAMIISCTLMTIHEHNWSTSFYLRLFLPGHSVAPDDRGFDSV